MIQIDPTGCCRDDSAYVIAFVANGEFQAEDLRVAVVALLSIHSVAIALKIRIDKIFSQKTKQDSHNLVNVVHCLAVNVV